MKCKNWSNKLNDFVVRKLKSFKINGQQKTSTNIVSATTTMPTIPKEKATPMPLTKNSFDDIKFRAGHRHHHHHHNHQQQLNQQQQQEEQFVVMGQKSPSKILTSTAVAATEITTPPPSSTNPTISTNQTDENSFLNEQLLAKLSITAQDIIDDIKSTDAANGVSPNKMSVDDFIFGRSVGEGSFSTVYQAKDVHTNKEYAIKVCDKQHILRERKQEYVRREREAMQIMSNTPGFVNLSGTFQDYQNLYFVMTYAKNGDLLPYMQKVGSFDLDCARYYAAELLISIEHMHKKGIIHRDLKPENILLDKDMHTLITDFGSVKILGSESSMETSPNRRRRCSFVGTAQYVSPEVLLGQDITRAADLWALGCIIYQMLTGLYPFRGDNEYLIFKEILNVNLEFPEGFDRDAADLIRSLLKLNPEERIGFQDKIGRYESIRTHPFFDEINWDVVRKQTPPQICSCVMDLHKDDDDDEFLCSR